MEKLDRDKHSGLFTPIVSNEEKVYNTDTWLYIMWLPGGPMAGCCW